MSINELRTAEKRDNYVMSRYNNACRTNMKLISLIQDRGYRTISDFADALGVSRSLISQIVHYLREPTTAMKLAIAKKLDTDSRIIFPEEKEVEDGEKRE